MLLTMLSHVVNDPIRLRYGLKVAAGAAELRALFGRMPRGHVNRQTLRLEKALLTDGALEGRLSLMTLHVVMHGVLIFLYGLTDTTHKETLCILLVGVCHGTWGHGQPRLQFLA